MFQDLQSPALCDYSNLDLFNYILSSECICMQIWKDEIDSFDTDRRFYLLHAIINSESTTTGSTSTYCTIKYRLLDLLLVII